jgi:hypothetical protein
MMLVNVCLRSCRNCKDVLPVFQRSTWFGCSSLSDNQFTGDFPSGITTLTKLTLLYVQATFSLGESLGHAAKTSRNHSSLSQSLVPSRVSDMGCRALVGNNFDGDALALTQMSIENLMYRSISVRSLVFSSAGAWGCST